MAHMFLNKKAKKAIKILWGVLGVIIILSMIMLYTPLFSRPSSSTVTPPQESDF